MKKLSYLLILFISLFIVIGIVKASDIVCTAKNDMEYTLVFESMREGGYLKQIKDKDGNKLQIYGLRTTRWRINDENYCPIYQNEFTVKKYNDTDAYTVVPTDIYNTRFGTDINSKNGCSEFGTYSECISNPDYACVWVDRKNGNIINDPTVTREYAYCNVDNLQYIQCGGAMDIPVYLPKITSFVINFLKILTPIILIFTSVISLIKAITSSKEDEMNKAKTILIRRIAIAALIFFTITITEFVIDKVADREQNDPQNISECLDCFINNSCKDNKYYKNTIDGKNKCIYIKDGSSVDCH